MVSMISAPIRVANTGMLCYHLGRSAPTDGRITLMTREMVSVVLSLAVVLSGIAALLVGRLLAAAYGLRRSTAVHLLSGMFGAALGIAVLARQVPNAEDAAVPMVLLYTILGALIFTFAINTARWAFSSPHLMGGTDLLLGDGTFASAAACRFIGCTWVTKGPDCKPDVTRTRFLACTRERCEGFDGIF